VNAVPAAALAYLADAAAAVAAVRAASDLGVLALLEAVPAHPADVAEHLELSPRGTGQLLQALEGLGLLALTRDGYVPTVPRSARAAAAAHQWDALAETVRAGVGPHHVDTPAGSEALYGDVVGFLSDLTGPAADAASKRLVAQGFPGRVLEVGSGAAPWSRALARQDEDIHVTALDLPQIIEVTRRHVCADGLERQFSFLPGDAFAVELDPTAYDLVLMPNVCHLFDAETNRSLLGRLAATLRPGGRLAVIDVLPGETPELALQVSLYALGLMIRTDAGGVHSEADYRAWLEGAGLHSIERWDVTPEAPAAMVIARA
jgi:ubiquinone/menaquinone biosynthesis C-methylase UbiE